MDEIREVKESPMLVWRDMGTRDLERLSWTAKEGSRPGEWDVAIFLPSNEFVITVERKSG